MLACVFSFVGEITFYNIFYEVFTVCTSIVAQDPSGKINTTLRGTSNAAFTLTTIRPRLVSWSSSWTNRDYRIQSYQIASHLDINRGNRANRGKIFGCQKFCHDYHDWRDYRDHRIRSYDNVTNRNKSYLILFLNRGDRDRPKHRDLLR